MRTNDSGCAELEEDRPADFGAEGFAVEDDLGAFALDADLVAFLEMDAAELGMAELAEQAWRKRRASSDAGRSSIATSLQRAALCGRRSSPDSSSLSSVVTASSEKRPDRLWLLRHDTASGLGLRRQEAGLEPQEQPREHGQSGQRMAEAVGQAERINLLAAVEHRVGEAGAAEEHADHRGLLAGRRSAARSARARRCAG